MKPPGEHPAWLDPLYAVAAGAFGAGATARSWLYDRGLWSAVRAERPVISVGNVTVGGSGKTPLVITLVEHLPGKKVGVLSRGYGRRSKAAPVVVSTGEGPLVSAEEGGDEPCLIAQRTSAIVVVDPDRVRGAARAIRLGAEVLILDDGFQHRRLHRDLDLVVLDGAEPFGNGHFLPRGPLRESPGVLSRADLLIQVGPGSRLQNDDRMVEVEVVPATVGPHPASWLRGRRVALYAAIARPLRFRRTVEALGATVVAEHFDADHHFTDPRALLAFAAAAQTAGAELVVTTEKDQARGPLPPDFLALGIGLQIRSGKDRLQAALQKLVGVAG
ncbi:MAG: tetraacyldisaccharide 4'-kinase [Deltaproteobacteria bacterium]|jgi:tetraacyldisaccharide 4'-kinase|nr:tetraacyldisaccharide 4'-kinase [Deltaproteobacteria bacterium]